MSQLRQVTLCFLVKGDQVLLAMKKKGFGQGWWNGTGGKVEEGETVEEAAIRETKEEINVIPKSLTKVAVIDFLFQGLEGWNQTMQAYLSTDWDGIPKETEEMKPKWFKINNLPFDSMWPADDLWIPLLLNGKKVKGSITFDKDKKLLSYDLKKVKNVN